MNLKKILKSELFPKVIFQFLIFSTSFVLLYNFLHYTPMLGYDSYAHYTYIDFFSRYLPKDFRLPAYSDTREYFSPPIPYIVPAFFQVLCRNIIESTDFLTECRSFYSRYTLIFQYFLYLLTTFVNLKILGLIFNKKSKIFTSYFLLISMLSVSYRSFSMIRGEPYIVFFVSILIYLLISQSKVGYKYKFIDVLTFGLVIGSLALSKQWAFLLFPSFFILFFYKNIDSIKEYKKFIVGSFAVGFFASSWFYIGLYLKYSTFTAFNLPSLGFNFSNKPFSFYVPSLSHFIDLFRIPIRPYLSNQFLTSLYADTWGDYWGYFSFTSKYINIGRNQMDIGAYFARVNLLSLFTTFIIIFFYLRFIKSNKGSVYAVYLNLSLIITLLGYLWFVISYPEPAGDTVKATYLLQFFYIVVLAASVELEKLRSINIYRYNIIIFILFIIYLHNIQTYLSHFPYQFIQDFKL